MRYYSTATGQPFSFAGLVNDRFGATHSGPNVIAAWGQAAIEDTFGVEAEAFPDPEAGFEIVPGSERVTVTWDNGLVFERDFRPVRVALEGADLATAIAAKITLLNGQTVPAESQALLDVMPDWQTEQAAIAAETLASLTSDDIDQIAAAV